MRESYAEAVCLCVPLCLGYEPLLIMRLLRLVSLGSYVSLNVLLMCLLCRCFSVLFIVLPARFGDDHFRAVLVELIPQVLGLELHLGVVVDLWLGRLGAAEGSGDGRQEEVRERRAALHGLLELGQDGGGGGVG
jgi:hypothetical protein